MEDYLGSVAAALGVASVGEDDELLDLVRDIAHATERRFGPLTLFMLGQAVAAGGDRDALIARVRALL
jgi:hypothetical protein